MRALRGMPLSGCAGIFCTSPFGLYSQPWYGQTMQSPLISPPDSAAPRCTQRSDIATTELSLVLR